MVFVRADRVLLLRLTQDIFNFVVDPPCGRVIAAFIYLKKAFDSIDHVILLTKLKSTYGLDGPLLKLLATYLTDRKFNVKLWEFLIVSYSLHRGVPQGSCLGPLLFILYIDNIHNIIGTTLRHILYADDLVIYLPATCVLSAIVIVKTVLKALNEWFRSNFMSISLKLF
jgi:hypothetical protein